MISVFKMLITTEVGCLVTVAGSTTLGWIINNELNASFDTDFQRAG